VFQYNATTLFDLVCQRLNWNRRAFVITGALAPGQSKQVKFSYQLRSDGIHVRCFDLTPRFGIPFSKWIVQYSNCNSSQNLNVYLINDRLIFRNASRTGECKICP